MAMMPGATEGPGLSRGMLATVALLGAGLLLLNVAALMLGWSRAWVVVLALVADVLALGVTFALAMRRALAAEAALERTATERAQERLRVQAALDEAEARYGAILESAMDAVITVDESHRILVFNRAAEAVFRVRRESVLGSDLALLLPERFRGGHADHISRFGRTGTTNRRMGDSTVLWALRADGSEFPIEASISQTSTGGKSLFTVILRDIERRKSAEDALCASREELRELSARLLEAREEEKTRIARELHDELGQSLTALKMDLAWIREQLPADRPELASKVSHMEGTLSATVAATRRISADLRPLMLDDLGLAEAAEWLVEEFSGRSGIECQVQIDDTDTLAGVPSAVATAAYRILQESLTNIARHAGARRVRVELRHTGSLIALTVEDDGRGIVDADQQKKTSFGLRGIRERVSYLGGSADISAMQPSGTRLQVQIPVSTKAASAANSEH